MSWLRRAGIAAVVTTSIGLTVTPSALAVDPNPGVNDQPDITLPSPVTTAPGAPVSFVPVVSDPDEHLLDMEMEIDISDLDGVGGRSVAAGDYGTFTWGGGTGVTSDLLLAPIAAVNTALSSFTFTPAPSFAGTARVIFEIDDQGNVGSGGTLSRTRFIDITVAEPGDADPAVNTPPDIALPAALATAVDTPITFAPVVSDPDAGPGATELEIDISDLDGIGGLSVPAGDYGTFTWGGGAGVTSDISVTPLATQNTDLSTFTYTPASGFLGTARIIFEIDDQGNSGSEFPPNVLSRTRFVDITVAEPSELAITKTADASVEPGDTLDYALTVTNAGPAAATAVTLSDPLPPDTTFVSLTQTSGPAFTLTTPPVGGTGTVTASIATLAASATATFTLTVEVDGGADDGAAIVNEATVEATSLDTDDTDNRAEATTVVEVAETTSTTDGSTTTTGSGGSDADDPVAATDAASGQRGGSSTGRLPVTGVAVATLVVVALGLLAAGTVLARRRTG
jgi:uncharacterized repeat protein (TIGR01451 family)